MIDFTYDVILWSGIYLSILIGIGLYARKAKKEKSLSDHFLAGRTLGTVILLLTLFATQYSGNTVSGFPGQTYRKGLTYIMIVSFMIVIITGYTLFAPKLYALAKKKNFLTPTDFLADRFGSSTLNYVSAIIFTFVLVNYLLAQLMAMGHAFSGLTNGQIPYWVGVVGGATVILIYEVLGGMRAVAWTDALQGLCLMIGLVLVMFLLIGTFGSPGTVIASIAETAPKKVMQPNWNVCMVWLSNFILLGLGAPLYPQAIQRLYAAKGLPHLKKALAVMCFLPFITLTSVIFIGLVGIILFPNLDQIASDQITFRVLVALVEREPMAYYPALVVIMAILAAIMSTADSCLLSLSSIFTKDFVARFKGMTSKQAEGLTRHAAIISISVMVIVVGVASSPRITLWGLLVLKFEFLIQLSPAFILGTLHSSTARSRYVSKDILSGLFVGLIVTIGLYFADTTDIYGLKAGIIGVFCNYATVWGSRRIRLHSRIASETRPTA